MGGCRPVRRARLERLRPQTSGRHSVRSSGSRPRGRPGAAAVPVVTLAAGDQPPATSASAAPSPRRQDPTSGNARRLRSDESRVRHQCSDRSGACGGKARENPLRAACLGICPGDRSCGSLRQIPATGMQGAEHRFHRVRRMHICALRAEGDCGPLSQVPLIIQWRRSTASSMPNDTRQAPDCAPPR